MQIIEIRPEADRFLRLLEILGEWYEKGKIIIFVQVGEMLTHILSDPHSDSHSEHCHLLIRWPPLIEAHP
jgi:hypothetical protein